MHIKFNLLDFEKGVKFQSGTFYIFRRIKYKYG